MTSTIGQLEIGVLGNIAGLVSDMGKAQQEAAKQAAAMQRSFEAGFKSIEESAHRATDGVMDAFTSLTGLSAGQLGIGAIAAGLGEVTKRAIETGDELNKLSQRTGIGVDALSGLSLAGELADVSLGDLTVGLDKFGKNIAGAAAGSAEQSRAFTAMGISLKDTNGQLKPTADLLAEVATKFQGYGDGANKVAIAQAAFGKAGAALIPLLNQGADGMRKASEEANALGYNFTGIAGKSEEFNDNLTRLGKAAVGIGVDIATELLPGLIRAEEAILDFVKAARENGYLQDFAKAVKFVADNLDVLLVTLASRTAINLAIGAFGALTTSAGIAGVAIAGVEGALALLGGPAGILAIAAGAVYYLSKQEDVAAVASDTLATALHGVRDATQSSLPSQVAATKGALDLASAQLKAADAALANLEATAALNRQSAAASAGSEASQYMFAAADGASAKADELRSHISQLHEEIGKGRFILQTQNDLLRDMAAEVAKPAPALVNLGAKTYDAGKAALEASTSMNALLKMVTSLSGAAGGPFAASAAKYANQLVALGEAAQDAAIKGNDFDAILKLWQQGEADAAAELVKTNVEIAKQSDLLGNFTHDLDTQAAMLGMTEREKAIAEAVAKVTAEYQKNVDAGKPVLQSLDELQKGAAVAEGKFFDYSEAQKQAAEVAKEWQGIAISAFDSVGKAVGDFATGAIKTWHDFGQSLVSTAKQYISQVIAEFLKLNVFNGIVNGLFGTNLATGGGGFGSVVTAGLGLVSTGAGATGATDFTSTAGGGTQNSLFNGASWLSAGQKLWQGFSTSGGNLLYGSSGSLYAQPSGTGMMYNLPGQGSAGFNGAYGGSTFGQALGVAGAAYAGYNRYQQGGALGGVAGGATYAVGTYALGAGIASAAAGTGLMAGLGALGPIGWIAIAAMLVDKFSGGKLFGTDGVMTGGWAEMSTSKMGGSAQNFIDMKGQSAFFGGATFSQDRVAASKEQMAAAQAFFDAIKKGSDDFAKQFGLDAGEVAAGIFSQKFDKKGNLTGETITHINGLDYNNETQQQFGERIQAESFTQDLAKIGVDITGYTHQFIKDADAYAQAVQDAAAVAQAANTDIKNGVVFLGTGADQSIDAIYKLAEASVQGGESIAQAFQRIEQSQIQYTQFVGQFKPAATYVDDYEASLANINATMQANIKQANALAVAAGASGAAEQDLANIHMAAAAQAAAALHQLEASAQQNAFALGVTNLGSLDQVSAEIARLQGIAGNASTPVQDFGNAMQQASQQASDAINLLLGDLSPLNDQKKLQVALQGLQAGTVSQDAVLQIGRRLYASSQAYNDLFRMVQQYPGSGGAGAQSVGSSSVGSAHQGLTKEESDRLKELLAEQQTLEAAQTRTQYQTLAQQIAEIASSKGESFQQVLDEMGIKDADLEKGLGLANDAALKTYIENIQRQTDSNGDNAKGIIFAINRLYDAITGTHDGSGPQPIGPGDGHLVRDGSSTPITRPGDTPAPPTAHEIGTEVGHAVGRHIAPLVANQPRSTRPRQPVN